MSQWDIPLVSVSDDIDFNVESLHDEIGQRNEERVQGYNQMRKFKVTLTKKLVAVKVHAEW